MIDHPCFLMDGPLHHPLAFHHNMIHIITDVGRVTESRWLLKILFPRFITKFRLVGIWTDPMVNARWGILVHDLSGVSPELGKFCFWNFLFNNNLSISVGLSSLQLALTLLLFSFQLPSFYWQDHSGSTECWVPVWLHPKPSPSLQWFHSLTLNFYEFVIIINTHYHFGSIVVWCRSFPNWW